MYSYNIVIRYEDNFSLLRELEFSLMCADEEDVKTFISNFEVDQTVSQRFVTFEKRKFWGKLAVSIIAAIIMIAIIMYIFRDVNWSNLI
ncbi:unknown [Clostridium sp. CAG:492]|nr:unknown [Clostridium sp. CAG:492]